MLYVDSQADGCVNKMITKVHQVEQCTIAAVTVGRRCGISCLLTVIILTSFFINCVTSTQLHSQYSQYYWRRCTCKIFVIVLVVFM